MLDVFVTVDVEIWTDNWDLSPRRLKEYFDRYILGRTSTGEVGLRHQLRVARDHELKFVFFVEPLFAHEFGLSPLKEIVDTIRDFGQEVVLHLHPEWSSKSSRPILEHRSGISLRDFSRDDQRRLIAHGRELLAECGVESVHAFRAGSFAANGDTIAALTLNEIPIDSSFNPADRYRPMFRESFCEPRMVSGIMEFPLTAYQDYPGHLRGAQIGSCSARELRETMRRSEEEARRAYVILSHSFELLNGARSGADPVVIRRFERLCKFLADHRDVFCTRWFADVARDVLPTATNDEPVSSPVTATMGRYLGQAIRRLVAR